MNLASVSDSKSGFRFPFLKPFPVLRYKLGFFLDWNGKCFDLRQTCPLLILDKLVLLKYLISYKTHHSWVTNWTEQITDEVRRLQNNFRSSKKRQVSLQFTQSRKLNFNLQLWYTRARRSTWRNNSITPVNVSERGRFFLLFEVFHFGEYLL